MTEPLETGYIRNGYEDPAHPTIVYGPRTHRDGSRVTVVERVDGTRFTIRVPPGAMGGEDRCHRGHEFTAENTYVHPSGARICRMCRRDRAAGRHAAEDPWVVEGDARSTRAINALLAVVHG